MPIDPTQLRTLVVKPVLLSLGLPSSEVAENLIMGTAAHESHLGIISNRSAVARHLVSFRWSPPHLMTAMKTILITAQT